MKNKVKKDSAFKEFWRDNERFADLFNGAVFGGRKVICAESLHEMDTDVSGTIRLGAQDESLERRRDMIKKFAAGMEFVLLGVESQQHIHYAMPLRNMLYDGMGYLKEYRSFPKRTEAFKTSDEFLSKMKKDDKLHPIITLTVYYGETPWDGPLSLRDMMSDIPKEMEGAFCNYNMNLLEVRKSGEYIFHNKDVAMAFDFTRAVFENRTDEVIQKYRDVRAGEEVWHFIDTMIDTEKMVEKTYIQGSGNMCEGLRLWAQEKADKAELAGFNSGLSQGISQGLSQGLTRGINQGRKEGELVGELSGQKLIISRMAENNLPLDKIAQLIGFPLEKIQEILNTEKVYH